MRRCLPIFKKIFLFVGLASCRLLADCESFTNFALGNRGYIDMWLKRISILNFKNIADASVEFSRGVNCLVGANGMGKSNMLEAVYYLSMTRSFLRLPDAEVMKRGADSMMVAGDYVLDSGRCESVSLGYAASGRKVLKRGGKEYRRMSAHIGSLPVVLISPQDHFLITGTPDDRRRLMDTVISQADSLYLQALMQYAKAIQQRNSMLRSGMADPLLLEGIESAMEQAASRIFDSRCRWVERLAEPFARYYKAIAGRDEAPSLSYASILSRMSLKQALDGSRAKDTLLGHTSVGTHRDDLLMLLSGRDLRRLGSQGQMKTYTIALRLAVFEFLHECKGIAPLLLLDDIFDKLDDSRVQNIMHVVSASSCFGQIFITDTGRQRIDAILGHLPGPYRLFDVADGEYATLKASDCL